MADDREMAVAMAKLLERPSAVDGLEHILKVTRLDTIAEVRRLLDAALSHQDLETRLDELEAAYRFRLAERTPDGTDD